MCELVQERQKSPWLWPSIIYNMTSSGSRHKKTLDILHGFSNKVHNFYERNPIWNRLRQLINFRSCPHKKYFVTSHFFRPCLYTFIDRESVRNRSGLLDKDLAIVYRIERLCISNVNHY